MAGTGAVVRLRCTCMYGNSIHSDSNPPFLHFFSPFVGYLGIGLLVGCVASCPQNCPFLEMVDDPEKVNACTTAFYEGQAAVMDPRESWVAKWLRVDNYLPGCYAITVTGQFDKEIEEELENRGCRWRCRPA